MPEADVQKTRQSHAYKYIFCKPALFAPCMLAGLHGSLYDVQLMLMDDSDRTL